MTAQAGAVACTIQLAADDWNPYELLDIARLYVEGASGLEAGDELFIERIRECLHQQKRTQNSATPAAVSVEALEGLVAELMARVEADKPQCTNDDGSYRSDAHRAAWNFADGLEHAADKVYELIKERA